MYLNTRKLALTISITGLAILLAIMVYIHNQTAYTASIDQRTFRAGSTGTVKTLDPALITGHEEQLVASAMFEGLVYFDEKSETIKPRLAKSWEFSDDGKSLIIKLKKNIKFHNSQPVTAQKVKAAWERSFSLCKDRSKTNLFMSVEGAIESLNTGKTTISGIEALNDFTLKIIFAKPNSAFPYMLCNPIFWIYDVQQELGVLQPGTGPFMLATNKDNQKILCTGNTYYHRGSPNLSAIEFNIYKDENSAWQAYMDGKLDYLDAVPLSEINNIKNNSQIKNQFIEKPLLEIYALGLNMNKEPFKGQYMVRRALNYAIDRNQIVEDIFGDGYRSIQSVMPTEVKGHDRDMTGYKFVPDKAAQLLETAGYSQGEGLNTIILSYNHDQGHGMVVENIAEQLAALGISVQLQPLQWEYYKKQMEQQAFTCFRISWAADYPDADSFLYGLFHSSMAGRGNYTGYNNPQADKLLEAARAEVKNDKERLKLLSKAERIIVDDAPFVWLFQKESAAIAGLQTKELHIDWQGIADWFTVELIKPEIDGPKTAVI